jgi:acyl-CoA thioesterase-1
MIRTAVTALLGLVLAVASAGFATAQTINIVAFGGSSTYGQGLDRQDAYPAKLERALRAKGHNVAVSNAGVSGDKTNDGLARLDRAVPRGTHIVIVEYGTNDIFAKVDRETIRANLENMLGQFTQRGAQILLIGPLNVDLEPLARKHNAAYTNLNFAGNQDEKYRIHNDPQLRRTGVAHFNAAGYDMIVARMLPLVEELIGRVRR